MKALKKICDQFSQNLISKFETQYFVTNYLFCKEISLTCFLFLEHFTTI
jgi:hypothetical protein